VGESSQAPRFIGRRHVERLAALGALLALAAAVVVLGYLLITRITLLPFALAALIVAALAGWTGLINRGLRRVVALAAAVLALAVAIILLGLSTLVGAAVVVGLVLVSVAAARLAIGRHRPETAPAEPEPVTTPVPASPRPVMLFNPQSGKRTAEKSGLVAKALRRGIGCVMLREGDDLRAIAEREIADGATAIGMAGGDGSQAIVADVARRHNVPFVCIPAGTRNHFAQDLGLDRKHPVRALDAFGPAVERRVDLASVNGHVFVNNASMGVYAHVVQSDSYRGAKMLTLAGMLPDLVGPDADPFDLRFLGPDGAPNETTDLLLVSNNPYSVVTPVGFASRPRLDAGELGILSLRTHRGPVPGVPAPQQENPGTVAWAAKAFRVDSADTVPVGIDGEAVRLEPPLRFTTLPGALRVRLAPSVVAPAAARWRPGPRETVMTLLRIIVNRLPANRIPADD
jgi:diacylglycerol kinase family enzyme